MAAAAAAGARLPLLLRLRQQQSLSRRLNLSAVRGRAGGCGECGGGGRSEGLRWQRQATLHHDPLNRGRMLSSSIPAAASSSVAAGAAPAAASSSALLLLLSLALPFATPATQSAAEADTEGGGGEEEDATPHLEQIDARLHRAYPEFMQEHLIHQTLSGEEKIEDLRLFRDRRDGSIVAYTRLGRFLSGHPGVVHGGTLAALLDNTFGVAFFGAKVGNGFTANLTVNYRRPVRVGTEVKVVTRVQRVEGRKVFLTGQIRDANDESILYTEATCLFVTSTSNLLRRQSKLNMG